MSTIIKAVDPASPLGGRSQTFTDSDFAADDILDIERTLFYPARIMEIDVESDASVQVRVNSQITYYPLYTPTKLDGMAPDLQTSTVLINTDAPSWTVENGQSLVVDDIPIKQIEIVALTAGSGVTIKVR